MNNRKIALYAQLSELVYQDSDGVPFKSTIADLKVKLIATFKNNDTNTRGMIIQDGDDFGIVLAYKDEPADWLPEFSVDMIDLTNNLGSHFLVNKELTSGFSSIKNVVIELLRGREAPAHFEWAGHGAGAGLATLGAFWTSQWPSSSTNLYSYGSPRVGDARFAELFNGRINECYRVVAERDPIPRVPERDNEGHWYKHVKGKTAVQPDGRVTSTATTSTYEKLKMMKRKLMNRFCVSAILSLGGGDFVETKTMHTNSIADVIKAFDAKEGGVPFV